MSDFAEDGGAPDTRPGVVGTSTKTRGDAAEAAAARLLVEEGRLEIVARNVVAGGV